MRTIRIMKSYLITCAALTILSCSESKAQGGYYMGGFGYGMPVGDIVGTTDADYVRKNVYGSFGQGLSTGVNIGYMVNEIVGLDLGLWYVIGSTYEFTQFSSDGNSVHMMRGHTFRTMPSIKIAGGNSNNMYAKFGFVLGIATELIDDETFVPSTGGGTLYPKHKFTGGFANGWTGAFGIDFTEDKTASVFIELNFCYQVFKPNLETIAIEGQPTQVYNLVDEPNPLAPNVKLKPSFPFSSVGITAGIKFSSKKKAANGSK